MRSRVLRLTVVAAVALGAITVAAATGEDPNPAVVGALAGGWLLMPVLLGASVRRPRLRMLLAVPAGAVTVALVFLCATGGYSGAELSGWVIVTAGIGLGGLLGVWFWYRMLPVPGRLDAPFSPGRWGLVAVHTGLVVAGLALVLAARAGG
jgi:hypothetical protein